MTSELRELVVGGLSIEELTEATRRAKTKNHDDLNMELLKYYKRL